MANYLDQAGLTYFSNKIKTMLAGKTEVKRLWVNASPTSAFSSQTVTINSSGYDAILVVGFCDTQYLMLASAICRKTYGVGADIMGVSYINGNPYFSRRSIAVTDTTVTFNAPAMYPLLSSSPSPSADFGRYSLLPYAVYGVKGGI